MKYHQFPRDDQRSLLCASATNHNFPFFCQRRSTFHPGVRFQADSYNGKKAEGKFSLHFRDQAAALSENCCIDILFQHLIIPAICGLCGNKMNAWTSQKLGHSFIYSCLIVSNQTEYTLHKSICLHFRYLLFAKCLKIIEKVAFNGASEAS